MNIAIVGSRTFTNYNQMDNIVYEYIKLNKIEDVTIVSGGASGADTYGEQLASRHKYKTNIIKPDWTQYGKSAGFVRNKSIVESSDVIFAFWDGKSQGTKHTIELCKKMKKKYFVIKFQKLSNFPLF